MKGFLLDEHLPPSWRDQLVHHVSLEVWVIGDPGAPAKGTQDPDILQWCETYDFILVTKNRRSMPKHVVTHLSGGGHIPGILVIPPKVSVRDIMEKLTLIAEASFEDEYRDEILYLPML